MGWHEWPLMVFTVLGQIAVGGFLVLALALMGNRLEAVEKESLVKRMFFVWLLLGIGFLASAFHLGSPLRMVNALNRIGSSGLSTEVAFGVLFFAAGGLYWLLAVMGKMPSGLNTVWLLIAMVLGVAFVYMMVNAYKISTVPTWNNGYTTVNFFMTMLTGGALLGYLLKRPVCACGGALLAGVSVAALVVSVCANLMLGGELSTMSSSVMQATTLVPDYGQLMAGRLVLIALGLACWIGPMLKGRGANGGMMFIGLLLVICGELIGRGVFYGLHMTVGMTYGG
jgi:anaerobic dimethyl sulfoxide reductase subunit C (anchor subunit)